MRDVGNEIPPDLIDASPVGLVVDDDKDCPVSAAADRRGYDLKKAPARPLDLTGRLDPAIVA